MHQTVELHYAKITGQDDTEKDCYSLLLDIFKY